MDNRDIRVRIDFNFPPDKETEANQLIKLLEPYMQYTEIINEGKGSEERGSLDVERCGHRLGLGCEKIERWELGKGKVIDIKSIERV